MDSSKQLMIAVLCGLPVMHEMRKGLTDNPAIANALVNGKGLSKADLFSAAPNGKSFFDYRQCWDNIDTLIDLIEQNGEQVSYKDFSRPLVYDQSPLDMARRCGSISQIFSPRIWKGHEDEMDNLWCSLSYFDRNRLDYKKIKRDLARAEGRKTREDVLAQAGVVPADIEKAAETGDLSAVKKKLAAAGTHLSKADIFLIGKTGDSHILNTSAKWKHAHSLFKEIIKSGGKMGKDDFLRGFSPQDSLLMSAVQYRALDKIFNQDIWQGRPYEMMALFSELSEDEQKDFDIQKLLSDVVTSCQPADISIAGLTATVDADLVDQAISPAPIRYLALKEIWNNIAAIKEELKQNQEVITLDHLRLTSGESGESCLKRAAQYGCFSEALAIAREGGSFLTAEDLLAADKTGENLVDVLAQRGEAEDILEPSLWTGQVGELAKVLSYLADNKLCDLDFDRVLSQANQLALRERFSSPPRFSP